VPPAAYVSWRCSGRGDRSKFGWVYHPVQRKSTTRRAASCLGPHSPVLYFLAHCVAQAWQEKVRELERARALKRKAADGTIPIFVQVCPGGPCCCSPSEVLRVYCGWCCQSRQVNPSLDGVTAGTEAEMRTLMGRKSVADSVRLEQEVATAEHATMIAREDLVCNGRALVTFRTREARQKCIDLLPYNGDRMIKLLAQGKRCVVCWPAAFAMDLTDPPLPCCSRFAQSNRS